MQNLCSMSFPLFFSLILDIFRKRTFMERKNMFMPFHFHLFSYQLWTVVILASLLTAYYEELHSHTCRQLTTSVNRATTSLVERACAVKPMENGAAKFRVACQYPVQHWLSQQMEFFNRIREVSEGSLLSPASRAGRLLLLPNFSAWLQDNGMRLSRHVYANSARS